MKNILYITRLSLLATILLVQVSGQSFAAGFTDRVLVIVNEDVITQSEFDYRVQTVMQEVKASGRNLPPNFSKQLLETMVNEKLQVKPDRCAAEEFGYSVRPVL